MQKKKKDGKKLGSAVSQNSSFQQFNWNAYLDKANCNVWYSSFNSWFVAWSSPSSEKEKLGSFYR
jgi:hypothetical protein